MDATELQELKTELKELKAARRSGLKRVVVNDRDVTYKSDEDMRRAQRELEDEIARAEGRGRRRSRSTIAVFRSGR